MGITLFFYKVKLYQTVILPLRELLKIVFVQNKNKVFLKSSGSSVISPQAQNKRRRSSNDRFSTDNYDSDYTPRKGKEFD